MNVRELFTLNKGDRSYDDLARACNGEITSQRLQQIATTKPKEFPKVAGVRAIARALKVTELAVVLAFAESLGLNTQTASNRLVQALPPGTELLEDDQLVALTNMIRVLVPKYGPDQLTVPVLVEDWATDTTTVNRALTWAATAASRRPDFAFTDDDGNVVMVEMKRHFNTKAEAADHARQLAQLAARRVDPDSLGDNLREMHFAGPDDVNQDTGSDDPA